MWGKRSKRALHVQEAEVIQPLQGTNAPPVLNILALIEPTDKNSILGHGLRQKNRRNKVSFSQRSATPLVNQLRCDFGEGHKRTLVRPIFSQDMRDQQTGTVAMMLQCGIPETVIAVVHAERQEFSATLQHFKHDGISEDGEGMELHMCPTPYVARKHKIVMCTSHQYVQADRGGVRSGLNTSLAAVWIEYHMLAGVEHFDFFGESGFDIEIAIPASILCLWYCGDDTVSVAVVNDLTCCANLFLSCVVDIVYFRFFLCRNQSDCPSHTSLRLHKRIPLNSHTNYLAVTYLPPHQCTFKTFRGHCTRNLCFTPPQMILGWPTPAQT
jgi:hypothetical protein